MTEALTPELVEALRVRAAQAAQAAVTEQVESGLSEGDTSNDSPGQEAQTQLYYGSVDEFVREYLRHHVYRRAINGRSRAWEHLWMDPSTG